MNSQTKLSVLLTLGVLGVSTITGCATQAEEPTPAPSAPVEVEAASEAVTLITTLEAVPVAERRTDLFASIRPDAVLVTDSSSGTPVESVVPLPDDEFYVSIAPFIEGTHDCYFHSLTTCQGEMGGEEFDLLIVDNVTGETIVDRSIQAEDNGFFGIWLERDLDATVTVTYGDLSATGPLATGPEDATCITTLQLT